MFKLREYATEDEKTTALREVIRRLDELPLKINIIRKYEAGIDVRRRSWSFDIVLIMDFDTMTDLDAYTVHPAHQAFIEFNKDYSVNKVCIDYLV